MSAVDENAGGNDLSTYLSFFYGPQATSGLQADSVCHTMVAGDGVVLVGTG